MMQSTIRFETKENRLDIWTVDESYLPSSILHEVFALLHHVAPLHLCTYLTERRAMQQIPQASAYLELGAKGLFQRKQFVVTSDAPQAIWDAFAEDGLDLTKVLDVQNNFICCQDSIAFLDKIADEHPKTIDEFETFALEHADAFIMLDDYNCLTVFANDALLGEITQKIKLYCDAELSVQSDDAPIISDDQLFHDEDTKDTSGMPKKQQMELFTDDEEENVQDETKIEDELSLLAQGESVSDEVLEQHLEETFDGWDEDEHKTDAFIDDPEEFVPDDVQDELDEELQDATTKPSIFKKIMGFFVQEIPDTDWLEESAQEEQFEDDVSGDVAVAEDFVAAEIDTPSAPPVNGAAHFGGREIVDRATADAVTRRAMAERIKRNSEIQDAILQAERDEQSATSQEINIWLDEFVTQKPAMIRKKRAEIVSRIEKQPEQDDVQEQIDEEATSKNKWWKYVAMAFTKDEEIQEEQEVEHQNRTDTRQTRRPVPKRQADQWDDLPDTAKKEQDQEGNQVEWVEMEDGVSFADTLRKIAGEDESQNH